MRIAPALSVVLIVAAAGCSKTAPSGPSGTSAADPLTGTTWQLLSIESMAPEEQPSTIIEEPFKYTVTFGDDGQAGFRVNCNRGNSTWKREGEGDSGGLTFGPIALTRMACPQPSPENQVAAALGRVRSYLVKDGTLNLSLEADSGVMHLEPLPTQR